MKFDLGEWLKGDKKIKVIIVIGVVLIIVIAFSGNFSKAQKSRDEPKKVDETSTEYKEKLELEIKTLIEKIDGVGIADVMITLKNDAEYIYAKEEKKNTDKSSDIDALQESDNYENTTILVEDENGRKQALIETRLEPTINGVLVVCDGGADPIIEEKVTIAVKTVLGIGANNVCVTY